MFDPTRESYTTEELQVIGDSTCTVRATVQDGVVVAGGFSVDPGAGLKPKDLADVKLDKVARRALKEAASVLDQEE